MATKSAAMQAAAALLATAVAVGMIMERRALRQSIVELQDRLAQVEARQKDAEERTVGMLDAIMGGLGGETVFFEKKEVSTFFKLVTSG